MCIFFGLVGSGTSQTIPIIEKEGVPSSIFQVLSQDGIKEITVITDLKKLRKGKLKQEPKYQLATLHYIDVDGKHIHFNVDVRARGKMRKQYCSFPPIKFRFSKKELKKAGLEPKFHTLKLVSHCKSSNKSEQLMMKEFFVYQMYNLLTDRSFRVKLLTVHYVDLGNRKKDCTEFAFFIENTKEMSARIGGKEYEPQKFKLTLFEHETTAVQDIFQFMIGNTDYKVKGIHNLKFVLIDGERGIFPIPYDFDYAGIIDAPYAVPAEGIQIKDVSQRYFTGFCQADPILYRAISRFQEEREPIFSLLENSEGLNKSSKKSMRSYIQSFYKILDNPASIEQWIVGFCQRIH